MNAEQQLKAYWDQKDKNKDLSKLQVDGRIIDLFMKFGGKTDEQILQEMERQAQYPDSKVLESQWPELAC